MNKEKQIDGIDLATLSCYSNAHRDESLDTEQGAVSRAIDNILPTLIELKGEIKEIDCNKCIHFEACKIAFRNSKDLGIYDCTEEEYFNTTLDCDYYIDNKTYRKASEVAREIFEEIEKHIMLEFNEVTYAELKKKYTESEKDDG